ncbi:MAG: hypothetical protein EGR48_10545, partial [Lachnospiraceae bacterium]|nr:hypothetical protein [Lachnospiraceae bacterium]
KKQFLCFRSFLQLWRKLFAPKTLIPLFSVIQWILAESVNRTPTADGMSFRRCLSEDVDTKKLASFTSKSIKPHLSLILLKHAKELGKVKFLS